MSFSDISIDMNNDNIKVESFEGANRERCKMLLKVLKINTNTQNGTSYDDVNDVNFEGGYKQALLESRFKKLRRESKHLFDSEDREMVHNDKVIASEPGTNVMAHSAVKFIEKYVDKVNKNIAEDEK
jgi:hypothetical protein